MGKLYDALKQQHTLFQAWRHIRSNGTSSKSQDTRNAIAQFDLDPVRNIRSLQSKLSNDIFAFDHQIGILKDKGKGRKRGIVLASVRNRIVERALLDVLQDRCPEIQRINSQPTSVGGVPNRSVPHGLHLVIEAMAQGKSWFARSDISGFFDNIPRDKVINSLKEFVSDDKFLSLITRATNVTLANETSLGEDRKLFPCDYSGVAQGSPLSSLFGNILLFDFDQKMNSGSVVCVRFIDDFIIIGETAEAVVSAFNAADCMLRELGLECINPYKEKCDPAKADQGPISNGVIFLGHQIHPGLLQPSRGARQDLLEKIRAHLADGRASIKDVRATNDSFAARGRYAQTLDMVDRVIGGWAEAFSYCNSRSTFEDIDKNIDKELDLFRQFFKQQCQGLDWKGQRRLIGVRLVGDVRHSDFNELPKIVEINSRFVPRKATTVSTDGSVSQGRQAKTKEETPGGWAFVTHDSDIIGAGFELKTTNNRMELLAVIRALEAHDRGPVNVHTDSQYVHEIANKKKTYKKNHDLWGQFEELCKGRRVKVHWVKGHSGDPYNEQADKMANAQTAMAMQKLRHQ